MSVTDAAKKVFYLIEFLIELGFGNMINAVLFNDKAGKMPLNSVFH